MKKVDRTIPVKSERAAKNRETRLAKKMLAEGKEVYRRQDESSIYILIRFEGKPQ